MPLAVHLGHVKYFSGHLTRTQIPLRYLPTPEAWAAAVAVAAMTIENDAPGAHAA